MHELAWAAEACLVSCVGDTSVFGLLQWADSFLAAQEEGEGRGGDAAAAAAEAAGGSVAKGVVSVPPSPDMAARSLRREGRTGALLRAACLSHLLREYARLREHDDFKELPPHLQEEVHRQYVSEGHAYLGDRESSAPSSPRMVTEEE